jgi:hypothetical protein
MNFTVDLINFRIQYTPLIILISLKIMELFSGFLYLYYESKNLSERRWCNMRVLKAVSSKS